MQPDVRELVDWATAHGFEHRGQDSRGHEQLRHRATGRIVAVASTPGEYRSLANSWANVERISGHKRPRPNAGKYRKGGRSLRTGFNMDIALAERDERRRKRQSQEEAEEERQRQFAPLISRHGVLTAQLDALAKRTDLTRADMALAKRLVEDLRYIESKLADVGIHLKERRFK